jgi:hypothetical protein
MRYICRGKISGGLRNSGHTEYPELDQDQGKPFLNTFSSLKTSWDYLYYDFFVYFAPDFDCLALT